MRETGETYGKHRTVRMNLMYLLVRPVLVARHTRDLEDVAFSLSICKRAATCMTRNGIRMSLELIRISE